MKRQHRLLLEAVFIGLAGAAAAQVFNLLVHYCSTFFLTTMAGYTAPGLPTEGGLLIQEIGRHGLWLIPLVTTIGGLISGLIVYGLAPEAEGHGSDTVVKSFHHSGGHLRPRVTPIKTIASAITIGSGGAAGREGPTALITAGVGSLYADLMHRNDDDRRLLILMGMAAGLAAIFRSPVGTAFFAIEVLYGGMEFEAAALLYTMVASIVAYGANGLLTDFTPLFTVPHTLALPAVSDYGWYLILGLASGIAGTILPIVFYSARDLFHKLPGPPHIKPAIGGLLLGIFALWLPQILGGGYGWIQLAIDGKLAISLLLILPLAKIMAMSLTVSSGGSGGVFAPSLYVGAMLGGALATAFDLPAAPFVIVGMSAVFGAAGRVPIATLLMVLEMTGGYQLLVVTALAVSISYYVQSLLAGFTPYQCLYEGQVEGRCHSPAHHAEYMEAALHILNNHDVHLENPQEHINLQQLLRTGICIDLCEGKQLRLGRAVPAVEGKTIADILQLDPCSRERCLQVTALFRNSSTLLPYESLQVRAEDLLLFIGGENVWKKLEPYFVFGS
jgi:CIC family chloride channel protein